MCAMINDYQKTMTKNSEDYLQTLREGREHHEDLRAEATHFLDTNSSVGIITGRAEMTKMFDDRAVLETPVLEVEDMEALKGELTSLCTQS